MTIAVLTADQLVSERDELAIIIDHLEDALETRYHEIERLKQENRSLRQLVAEFCDASKEDGEFLEGLE